MFVSDYDFFLNNFAAPGAPGLFKPAVGTTQIITPQAQMRQTAPVVNRGQTPVSFPAMQIPATLTIRNTAPANQARAMSVPSSQPSTQPKPLPINTQTKIGKQTFKYISKYGMCMILGFSNLRLGYHKFVL